MSKKTSNTLQIDRSGEMNSPKLGPVVVAGLAFDDTKALIHARVSNQDDWCRNNRRYGSLAGYRHFYGRRVPGPGSYSVSALSTVTQAMFVAGGVISYGSSTSLRLLLLLLYSKEVGHFG